MKLSTALAHAATALDKRQSRSRLHNPCALAHYFGAIEEIEKDMKRGMSAREAINANTQDRDPFGVLKLLAEEMGNKEAA